MSHNKMNHQRTTEHGHGPEDPRMRGVLWAMAFALIGIMLLRAGGVGPDQTALADMVSQSGSYTAMTTQSGSEELLYMIDDRAEKLHVYRVRQANAVDLVACEDLRQMFIAARAAALGAQPADPARP